MRIGFRYQRATVGKLWAWRRGGEAILGPLLAVNWHAATAANPREGWVISDPLPAKIADKFREVLGRLDGIEWFASSRDESAKSRGGTGAIFFKPIPPPTAPIADAESRPAETAAAAESSADDEAPASAVHIDNPNDDGLPIDAFLLAMPWRHEPARPREVLVCVRGENLARHIVADLSMVADTTVLEGARSAVGLPGPWPSASADDHWFRLSEPPYFLIRRWLDSLTAADGSPPRVFCMMPPSGPGRPHLWILWGFEPALVQDQEFDAGEIADSLVVVAPCEPVRLLPASALRPLAERLVPTAADLRRARTVIAPSEAAAITIPLSFKPRTPPTGGKLWRVSERRLRDEPGWYEQLNETVRNNLQFAPCIDRQGEVMLFLTEKVRGRSSDELAKIAEPLAEVPGLPNCYLSGGYHLVPEINAVALAPLIYRAADSAGLSKVWSRAAAGGAPLEPEQLDHLASVGAESNLPMAVLSAETVTGALADAETAKRAAERTPISPPASKSTARPSSAEIADPWGAAMDDESAAEKLVASAVPPSMPAGSPGDVAWAVYFLPRSSFQSFDRLGTLLLRHAQGRLRLLQLQGTIAWSTTPTEPAE